MTVDLKKLAWTFMEGAKYNLAKDGSLAPCVVLVAEKLHVIPLQFKDQAEKDLAYAAIADVAKELKASACIAINDAYMKSSSSLKDLESHVPGDLALDPKAEEAIIICVKFVARDKKDWALACPYRRVNGKIKFSSVQKMKATNTPMIPDWN